MTTQEIKDEIARISCSIYDGATAEDMKNELDILWDRINESKSIPNEDAVYDEVLDIITGASQDDVDEMVDYLEDNIAVMNFVDEKIDDGCDEGEDDYVMMRSFDFTYKGVRFYLRIFYGNNTMEVGTYDLRIDD